MRERTQQINFRVTKAEKVKIHRKARRCGLADAEYIRNCALDRKVLELPREGLMTAYRKISALIPYLEQYNDTQKEVAALKSIQGILLDLYHGKEVDVDGGNEDLESDG